MHLHDAGVRRHQEAGIRCSRWNGPVAATTLVASIGPTDVSAWKPVPSGLRCSAVIAATPCSGHGCGDLGGIGGEIIRHLVARSEAVGFDAGDEQVGEAVVPGGAVGVQRVPALRAPAFSDAVAFQDEVRPAALAELGAHHQAGLAAADDQGYDFLRWQHGAILFWAWGRLMHGGHGGHKLVCAARFFVAKQADRVRPAPARVGAGLIPRPSQSFVRSRQRSPQAVVR